MLTKICTTCKIKKNLNKFSNCKSTRDGKQFKCKECAKIYSLEYYSKNKNAVKQYSKQYRYTHKEKVKIDKAKWRNEHLEYCKEYNSIWRKKNSTYHAEYRKTHLEMIHKWKQVHRSKRLDWGTPQPINIWFENSHCHHLHINNDHRTCIYIPVELHKSVWHAYNKLDTMIDINLKILQWYYGLTIKW